MVELTLLAVLLVVAVGGVCGAILSAVQLNRTNEEIAQAHLAAHQVSERMQSLEFGQLFALYNDDPSDDPEGEGTAPGRIFKVGKQGKKDNQGDFVLAEEGLFVAEILFPGQKKSKKANGNGNGIGNGNGNSNGIGNGNAYGHANEPALVLLENVEDPDLGMPRDLSGDGVVDDENHADDYQMLPLTIHVEWADENGPRSVQHHLLLTQG